MKHIETFEQGEIPSVEVVDAGTIALEERMIRTSISDERAKMESLR